MNVGRTGVSGRQPGAPNPHSGESGLRLPKRNALKKQIALNSAPCHYRHRGQALENMWFSQKLAAYEHRLPWRWPYSVATAPLGLGLARGLLLGLAERLLLDLAIVLRLGLVLRGWRPLPLLLDMAVGLVPRKADQFP